MASANCPTTQQDEPAGGVALVGVSELIVYVERRYYDQDYGRDDGERQFVIVEEIVDGIEVVQAALREVDKADQEREPEDDVPCTARAKRGEYWCGSLEGRCSSHRLHNAGSPSGRRSANHSTPTPAGTRSTASGKSGESAATGKGTAASGVGAVRSAVPWSNSRAWAAEVSAR
jgi:hypothetical protein